MKMTTNTGSMHNASQKLTQLAEEYTSVYTNLLNTASTMGDAYNSPDNLVFVEQINGFLDELKAMTGHIQQAASALDQQAANYVTTVEDNIATVRKLAN